MPGLKKIRDGVTPDLRRKARAVRDKRPLLLGMGRAAVSLGKRAFTDASLRPSPWKARKDNKPHNLLQLTTTLRKSIRVTSANNKQVTLGSDRKYAAIHQLGGKAGRNKSARIPARPYLPFRNNRLTARGNLAVTRALRSGLRAKGIH